MQYQKVSKNMNVYYSYEFFCYPYLFLFLFLYSDETNGTIMIHLSQAAAPLYIALLSINVFISLGKSTILCRLSVGHLNFVQIIPFSPTYMVFLKINFSTGNAIVL